MEHDLQCGVSPSGPILRLSLPTAIALPGVIAICCVLGRLSSVGAVFAIVLMIAFPVSILLFMLDLWYVKERVRKAYQLRRLSARPVMPEREAATDA